LFSGTFSVEAFSISAAATTITLTIPIFQQESDVYLSGGYFDFGAHF